MLDLCGYFSIVRAWRWRWHIHLIFQIMMQFDFSWTRAPDMPANLTSRWCHNGRDGVSNHQPRDCLLKRLLRRKSKKTSKLRVTGLCAGNSPRPVNSPYKWPVTRKMFQFHDVIMSMRRKPLWCHDSVIKWKHFPRYWLFLRGIHRSPVDVPHKGQWRGALMFSLICAWANGSVIRRWFATPSRLLWCHCSGDR